MTDKPNLTRVWAKTAPGGNVVDPDTVTAGKFAAGWQAEVPPFEYFNFIQKQITEGLAHINEQGIAVWDDVTTYPVGGLAKGSDGNVYKSLVSQNDNDPVSDNGTNWVDELNNRVIRVTSISAMEAYSAPVGYVFSLNAGGRSGTFDVVAGDFSTELAADTYNGIYVGLADNPTATAKVAKRSIAQTVTPRCFGAVDGALSQELAIEAFFNWAGRQEGEYLMAHDGDYYVSRGVRVESCQSANFNTGSSLIIRSNPGVYIDEPGLRLYSCDNGQWGRLFVVGESGSGGFRNGIVGTRVRRGKFAGMGANYCRLFGVTITSLDQVDDIIGSANNNNGTIIEKIDANSCGNNEGITVAFTETSRTYTPSNPGQSSTLSVDLDDYFPTLARSTPFMFGGKAFTVLSYDKAAQEATVFPCMAPDPDGLVSGNLILLPGGGLSMQGGDAGQLRTEQVNIRFCSVGMLLQNAYGGTTKGLTSQFNGIDIVHGRPPVSFANSGETILTVYSEQHEFLNVLSLTEGNASIDIWGTIEDLSTSQILSPLPYLRENRGDGPLRLLGSLGQVGSRLFGGVPRVTTWRRGTPGQSLGVLGGAEAMGYPGGTVILSPDYGHRTYTFELAVDNVNTQAFGDSGFELVGMGFESDNEIVLTAPTGETIDGLAVATYTGLPVNFHVFAGRVTATTWEAHIIELDSGAAYLAP